MSYVKFELFVNVWKTHCRFLSVIREEKQMACSAVCWCLPPVLWSVKIFPQGQISALSSPLQHKFFMDRGQRWIGSSCLAVPCLLPSNSDVFCADRSVIVSLNMDTTSTWAGYLFFRDSVIRLILSTSLTKWSVIGIMCVADNIDCWLILITEDIASCQVQTECCRVTDHYWKSSKCMDD